MRNIQLVLFTAIAALGWAVNAHAVPTVVLGNYELLPNTPGQEIPLYVTGLVPNAGSNSNFVPGSVNGPGISATINGGGVAYGGTPGPVITSIDVDSGPTIWVAPQSPFGHNAPATYYVGQGANSNFLTTSGWVNVEGGLFATLVIDTTGFNSGTYSLELSGTIFHINEVGNSYFTGFFGGDVSTFELDIPPGTITIVPEPSSVGLAALGLIGLAAWGWRRKRAL